MDAIKELGLKGDSEEATSTPASEEEQEAVTGWLNQISAAKARQKDWMKKARQLEKLYEGGKSAEDGASYNILFSNTDTLLPALYNSTPRPRVTRRYKDQDPLGKAASQVVQRTLEFLLDPGDQDYTEFDVAMQTSVLEGLVPGRGVQKFKYDAAMSLPQVTGEDAVVDADTSGGGSSEEEGEAEAPIPMVDYETACVETIPWDRFLHGYAKRWTEVPWASYIHFMSKSEVKANFGAEIAEAIGYGDEEMEGEDSEGKDNRNGGLKLAEIHEVWDKEHKKVLFVSPHLPDRYIKAPIDDPLGLAGFYPSQEPLRFVLKMSNLVPVPPYQLYESQAKELNTVTVRIDKLVKALKVRGMYDKTIEGMEKVLTAEDNTLVPADNVAALLSNGMSLDKSIWLVPIETIIQALQQLYLQRQQVKTVIFEIMGMADIMRGSSQASETLGAQEIKNQWGTLRLKRMQKAVMRFSRNGLRIMAEIAITKFSPETLKKMTGLPFPMQAEKEQALQAVQSAQAAGQQPDQQMAAAAQAPSWEELLAFLRDDLLRSYRIDIETNSTIDAEATEDKADIAELMNALSQFLNGIAPLVESGQMPFAVAKAFLQGIVRRFRFGDEVEEALEAMQEPPPKQDPKAEADKAKLEGEMQLKQLDYKLKEAEVQLREKELMMEMAFKEKEHAIKMADLDRKAEMATQAHSMKLQQMAVQAAMPRQSKAPAKPAGNRQQ